MAISKKDLLLALSNEEPAYDQILQKLDENSVQILAELARGRDTMLATKAIYLAGLYNKPSSIAIVESASRSRVVLKRIASASALEHLSESHRDRIAEKLIKDNDISIQKLAIRAAKKSKSEVIKAKLTKLSKESPSQFIRKLIKE